ncbi:MAG: energy transducer TonB [Terracidiphilus sp.]
MHYRRFLLIVPAVLVFSLFGLAQDVIQVDKLILKQHEDHRVYPAYPPIAKAAGVLGTVVVQVQVGKTGEIESVNVVSGPGMLRGATIDAMREWRYRPFVKDGVPVVVSGTVSFEFNGSAGTVSYGSGFVEDKPKRGKEKILKKFMPLAEECKKAISAQTDSPIAVSVCEQAAETAAEFAPDVRFIEKRFAYVRAADAFEMSGDLKTALVYAGKAVDVVKLGHDDDLGSNAAYGIKGIIEGKLGSLIDADQDLTIAEDFERKGIVWAEQVEFERSDSYKRVLAQDLQFHAQVLKGLNHPDEAQKKLDEAAKITDRWTQ